MTIQSILILKTVALAVMVSTPIAAAAQSPRSTPVPTPAAQAPRPAPAPAPATAPARTTSASNTVRPWSEQEYRLGAGDKLRVEVYGEPQLSQSLQVRPDGKITLPLVGDSAASGRTALELRDAIATSLKEFINNPVVTVIVVEATAAQVYVIGEVAAPGTQVMQGPMTVLQVLAQAGGLREFADRDDIRILRKGNLGIVTVPFNYKDALRGRIEPVYLQPGDTVVVP